MDAAPPPGHPFRFSALAHGNTAILGPLLPAELDALVAVALAELRQAGGATPVALDIGCGKGDLLVRLAQHGVRGTGIDRNPWFIADAKEHARVGGVGDMVAVRTADAADVVLPHDVDIAACIGATGALGGPVQAPGAIAQTLRAGGVALIGELFWQALPPADAVTGFGIGPNEVVNLEATAARVAAGGLQPLAVVQASQAGWDAYEDAYAGAIERWAAGHPDDPDREGFLEAAAMMRATWTSWRRAAMGFAVVVARRPAT